MRRIASRPLPSRCRSGPSRWSRVLRRSLHTGSAPSMTRDSRVRVHPEDLPPLRSTSPTDPAGPKSSPDRWRPGSRQRSGMRRRAQASAPRRGPRWVPETGALHCAPPPLTCTVVAEHGPSARGDLLSRWGKVEYGGATRSRRAPRVRAGSRRVEQGRAGEVARSVFLGTHTPRLDEKGRLFLPAKFRDRLADGLVITKGQERCLFVFPMDEFERLATQMQQGPVVQGGPRLPARLPLRRPRRDPRQAGPDHHPAAAAHYAGLDRDVRGHRRRQPRRGLGQHRLGQLPRGQRAGLRRAVRGGGPRPLLRPRAASHAGPALRPPAAAVPGRLPPSRAIGRDNPPADGDQTAGPPSSPRDPHRADPHDAVPDDDQRATGMAKPPPAQRHRPVLRDRFVELLAPALAEPGAVCVDGTLGMGGHAEAMLERCPEARLVGIDRDHAGAGPRGAAAGAVRRPAHAACTPCTTSSPRSSTRSGCATVRRRALRPRRLLAAARRGRTAASPTASTPRSTCGWTRPTGTTAADVLNTYDADDLARILRDYGEERFARAIARRRRPGPRDRAVHDARAGSSSCSAPSSRRPRSAAAGTRPSGPSRPCASRSTASSAAWSARCPRRSTRWPSAAGSSCSATTRSRTGSSSGRSPRGRRRARRPACRSSCPSTRAYLRLLTRGAEEPTPAEVADEPARRVRAAARRRTGPSHETTRTRPTGRRAHEARAS